MKLPLATGVLSAAVAFQPGSASVASSGRFVLRVDRTFDRREQPLHPTDDLAEGSYRDTAPSDRWLVVLRGSTVRVTELTLAEGVSAHLEGFEISSTASHGRRYELRATNFGALGGRLVLRGDEAELTIFGGDVPIIASERGLLVPR